jgi:hypothetical protein
MTEAFSLAFLVADLTFRHNASSYTMVGKDLKHFPNIYGLERARVDDFIITSSFFLFSSCL